LPPALNKFFSPPRARRRPAFATFYHRKERDDIRVQVKPFDGTASRLTIAALGDINDHRPTVREVWPFLIARGSHSN